VNEDYLSGGTNFDSPLLLAAEIARKCIGKYKVVVILMTDGQAPFPFEGVKAMKAMQGVSNNVLKYAGISFRESI
jgi:Mg-chelatase subunit ChlD